VSAIVYRWDGEVMVPLARFHNRCNAVFTVGELYPLDVHEDRSIVSHRHYFCEINEAWKNLPEMVAERYPSSEHLRKYALIQTGYRDERSIACSSKAEAQRVAAFIKPMDDYAVVVVREAVVSVLTAKSQSIRAMGAKEFQASKQAVLDQLASMIGVTPGALEQHAGRAA
jgi:hypothetical protein